MLNTNRADQQGQQRLFGIQELATRWGVSKDLVRKLVDAEELRSVTIASRRLIPWTEIQRAELVGVGRARKTKAPLPAVVAD